MVSLMKSFVINVILDSWVASLPRVILLKKKQPNNLLESFSKSCQSLDSWFEIVQHVEEWSSTSSVVSVKLPVCLPVLVAYKCAGYWWKAEQIEEDHREVWMSERLCAIVTTGLCLCGASGGLSSSSSKALFKELPSLRQTEWHPCHLSLPMSELQPSSGVIWCRHAPRASVRHRVTPRQAWLWPGSRSGLGAAAAVRCCKWMSELTDGWPSVPADLCRHCPATSGR